MLVPTLSRICCDLLITHRQHLGDVGWIPVQALRTVLFHCDEEELARIEDETKYMPAVVLVASRVTHGLHGSPTLLLSCL